MSRGSRASIEDFCGSLALRRSFTSRLMRGLNFDTLREAELRGMIQGLARGVRQPCETLFQAAPFVRK